MNYLDKTYPRKKVNLAYIGYTIFILFTVAVGFYFDYQDCLEGISC